MGRGGGGGGSGGGGDGNALPRPGVSAPGSSMEDVNGLRNVYANGRPCGVRKGELYVHLHPYAFFVFSRVCWWIMSIFGLRASQFPLFLIRLESEQPCWPAALPRTGCGTRPAPLLNVSRHVGTCPSHPPANATDPLRATNHLPTRPSTGVTKTLAE